MESNGNVWKKPAIKSTNEPILKLPENLKFGSEKAIDIFRRNKATLLAISYSTFSDPAIENYFSALPHDFPKYVMRPITNPLKWALWSSFAKNNETSYTFFGDVPKAEDIFGMENKLAAYLFLIDSAGKIRWKSAGPPSVTDLVELKDKIKILFYE